MALAPSSHSRTLGDHSPQPTKVVKPVLSCNTGNPKAATVQFHEFATHQTSKLQPILQTQKRRTPSPPSTITSTETAPMHSSASAYSAIPYARHACMAILQALCIKQLKQRPLLALGRDSSLPGSLICHSCPIELIDEHKGMHKLSRHLDVPKFPVGGAFEGLEM